MSPPRQRRRGNGSLQLEAATGRTAGASDGTGAALQRARGSARQQLVRRPPQVDE